MANKNSTAPRIIKVWLVPNRLINTKPPVKVPAILPMVEMAKNTA